MQIKEKSYKVAGHVFTLKMEEDDKLWNALGNYEPFACEADSDPVFTLELVQKVETEGKKELYISDPEDVEQRIDIYTMEDGYLFEMAPFGNVPVCGWLRVDSGFTTGSLMVEKDNRFCVNNALMLMYAFRTADLDTLEMHASVTVKDGKGFLFLGKSGTGKSTHSSLWLKNIPGTHLLNDDNPIVRIVDGQVRVYGSPWSGKTPCYRNEDYPAGAFVRINRAPYDAIHRMSIPEAFASISSSSSGLRAIRRIGDGLYSTLSSVVQTVPCYVLDCLPDDEAAIVCSKEVLGNA
ncbi:MAG: hypothetical protein IJ205_08325 [Bacteroidales bacterium]|nr:hypothetical protein [Bacteroidales bacterium]